MSKLSNVEEIRNLLGYVISCFHLVLVSLLLLLLLFVLYYQSMVNKHYLNVWLYLGLSFYAGMCPTSPSIRLACQNLAFAVDFCFPECTILFTRISMCFDHSMALVDKPTPPRNLTVTAITAETADLQWEVPEDDGGSPITHYIVEKKDVQRKTWQEVSKPTELTTQVGDLHDQNQYLFRVSAANQYGVSDPVELTEPITAKNPFSKSLLINDNDKD